MSRPPAFLALALLSVLAGGPGRASAEEVTRRVGRLTVAIDESAAYPGGLIALRLRSAPRFGGVQAIFEGRRCPFLSTRRGLRALVPVGVDATPGSTPLGIELRTGRGRQRFALQVTVAERAYAARSVALPDVKKAMLTQPKGVHDGRLVQLFLRTESPRQEWQGAFLPPVGTAPEPSFGSPQTYDDAASPVEAKTDAIWGEYHRGLDYLVPAGTAVSSPAAGRVLFAGPLLLTGETVILDHGQGVVSVFYHLASTSLREGNWVEAGAPLGLSGETGIAAVPHLHWGVYVHSVAVDPQVMLRLGE
jgi:murein DD-endopeptidase MepM/ murein hydrolase activator NlpD